MTFLLASLVLAQLTAKKANWWDVSVRYPRFVGSGPVAKAANAEAASRERKAFREFLAEAKKEMPGIRKEGGPGSYQLEIVPHRITDRAKLASGYIDRYDYRAGAHGSTSYEALNVGLVGGRVRPFGLRDLFRPGQDAVGQASRAIVGILKADKDPVPSNVASGEWKGLDKEQVDRFVVGPKGILFLFGSYELGAYVEGPRLVLVPWAKLPGIDQKGVLSAIIP